MDRPRVVLYEDKNRDGSAPTMIDDSTTPLDSIASPAVYYQDNYSYPRKFLHRGSKPTAGTPTRFLRQLNDDNDMVYPDDDDNRFIRFLKKPTTQIIVCVIIGTALGALLSHLQVSTDISNLVNLPGRVFLRVLKCFVIPMVFASLSTGIANIVLLGKVSTIGTRTAFFFVTFSFTAVLISLGVAMTLRHLNHQTEKLIATKTDGWFHMHCDNGKYLEMTSAEGLQYAFHDTRLGLCADHIYDDHDYDNQCL
uniref:Amino acid transporter n=1 Tax=Globisporangium ultimum (strain ATCC 200006 / CBS 805.95 / DAOM BR144) TaxID=431595 RepID=K3WWZ5_GLOUD